ncbi:MAG: DUF983 domain-containing protein [Bacteroidia bacterium]|nr:DUF983 domain-containing protein [Bacteroidia bacterium]
MNTIKTEKEHGYLWGIFHHKCSRCRAGDMFQEKISYNLRRFMKMNEKCPVCEQPMETEVGFYYGSSYVSYTLTTLLTVVTFIAWWAIIGISLHDYRIFWWMGLNVGLLILLQPFLMRLSRTIWLSFFVSYNINWRLEKPEVK